METVRLLEMVTDEGKAEKFLGEKGILKTFTEFPSSFLSLKFLFSKPQRKVGSLIREYIYKATSEDDLLSGEVKVEESYFSGKRREGKGSKEQDTCFWR